MTTEVKKTRKPRAKKAAKKVETVEQPQVYQVQLEIEDLITWDDAKCNETDIKVPLIQIRDILRKAKAIEGHYNVLRTVLMTGAMLGYSVECPQCHKVYDVNPKDLVREGNAVCSECGALYEQIKAIRGITTYEKEKVTNA